MGYALFTARKLMLQNRLNQMNYRMMVLSQQRNELVQQSADIEMQNGYSKTLRSIFAAKDYQAGVQEIMNKDYGTGATASTQQQADLNNLMIKQTIAGGQNDLQAQNDKTKLSNIYAIENQIDLEMKKLDTQVKETTAEMESVEKAEEQAIKASAPKYGGGAG